MDSTNYWKCVLNFPPTWLANWHMAFWTGQSWSVPHKKKKKLSWYTGRGPEQQFWSCFTDRILEVWFCQWRRQWIQPHKSWNKVKSENKERGGEEKNVLSLPSLTSFSYSLPNHFLIIWTPNYFTKNRTKNTLISTRLWIPSTWFKFGVAGGHPTKNHFYISLYHIYNTFRVLKTVRVLILAVFMVHPDKQKWY